MLWADQEEYENVKGPGWIFAVGRNTHIDPEDILIDSGAAMSVCAEQRGLTQPKGRGTALVSATRHRFNTLGAAAMVLDCVGGPSVQSMFQVAPKNSGLQNTIISVGEVTDKGNVVVFRSTGGSIVNLGSGRWIDFPRRDGIYKLNASMRLPAAPDWR